MIDTLKMADESERQPLLPNNDNTSEPPPYINVARKPQTSYPDGEQVMVSPARPGELPPPYTSYSGQSINCNVCQTFISIDGKQNQSIVTCDVCKEATPIKGPLPGKRFVRCPCHCLLVCNATSVKVTCPRENCKRTINLVSTNDVPRVTSNTIRRVQCVHCRNLFLLSAIRSACVKCPTCYRMSTVEYSFVRNRMIIYLIIAAVFLVAGISVTAATYSMAKRSGGIYTVWVGAFAISVVFFLRGMYFATIKTSTIV